MKMTETICARSLSNGGEKGKPTELKCFQNTRGSWPLFESAQELQLALGKSVDSEDILKETPATERDNNKCSVVARSDSCTRCGGEQRPKKIRHYKRNFNYHQMVAVPKNSKRHLKFLQEPGKEGEHFSTSTCKCEKQRSQSKPVEYQMFSVPKNPVDKPVKENKPFVPDPENIETEDLPPVKDRIKVFANSPADSSNQQIRAATKKIGTPKKKNYLMNAEREENKSPSSSEPSAIANEEDVAIETCDLPPVKERIRSLQRMKKEDLKPIFPNVPKTFVSSHIKSPANNNACNDETDSKPSASPSSEEGCVPENRPEAGTSKTEEEDGNKTLTEESNPTAKELSVTDSKKDNRTSEHKEEEKIQSPKKCIVM